jgi:hypothetical protein
MKLILASLMHFSVVILESWMHFWIWMHFRFGESGTFEVLGDISSENSHNLDVSPAEIEHDRPDVLGR